MSKIIRLIICFFSIGIISFLIIELNKPMIYLKNLTVEINENLKIEDFIDYTKNVEVLNSLEMVDTTSLEKKKENIIYLDKMNNTHHLEFEYKVIDTIPPVIETSEYYFVKENEDLDINKYLKISDNSNYEVKVIIDENIDTSIIGVNHILIQAIDKANNLSTKQITIIVEQQITFEKQHDEVEKISFFNTSKGNLGYVKNGVTYIDGIVIVNKSYRLPKDCGIDLTDTTKEAWNKMKNDCLKEGYKLFVVSGFRSYDKQNSIYSKWLDLQGAELADTHSARPSHSEHQTGMALDINSLNWKQFMTTKEYGWLKDNCWKYGFILRYVENKNDETGYGFEPWHYRYVGNKLAKELYNEGNWITLEDYFGITSVYDTIYN